MQEAGSKRQEKDKVLQPPDSSLRHLICGVHMKKIVFSVSCILFLASCLLTSSAHARTEGFYIGGGYQQPVMFTWKDQSVIAPDPGSSIKFWPNFGAFLMGGYEFERPDWLGLALSANWGMLKLNSSEWVNLINGDMQVNFHFLDPDRKFDPYVGALAGFNYMTEGKVANQSASLGPDFGAAFGFKYTLMEYAMAGSPNVTNLSLMVEVPVKIILFLNDNDLSDSSTTPIIQIPVKVGLTYSF